MAKTAPQPVTRATFAFLDDLSQNNDRDWFNAEKARFKADVEAPFIAALDAMTARLSATDLPWIAGRETMFRIHRDTRFSKDKTPYKTNVSALISPDGSKTMSGPCGYVQLGSDRSFAIVGTYQMPPAALGPIRDAIVADPARWDDTTAALRAAGRALESSDALKSMPRGYAEHAAAPFADALRRKDFMVREELSRDDWLSGAAPERVARLITDGAPLVAFLREATGGGAPA